MTAIVLSGTAKLADAHAPIRTLAVAGQAISIGACCFIESDGLAYLCDATDHVAPATVSKFEGIALSVAAKGQPVTLFGLGSKIYLTDTAQTIGGFAFVSNAEGGYDTAKVATGDTQLPVGKFITTHVLEVTHSGGPS